MLSFDDDKDMQAFIRVNHDIDYNFPKKTENSEQTPTKEQTNFSNKRIQHTLIFMYQVLLVKCNFVQICVKLKTLCEFLVSSVEYAIIDFAQPMKFIYRLEETVIQAIIVIWFM